MCSLRYRAKDLLRTDVFLWAARKPEGGFWRRWMRWQRERAWYLKTAAAGINTTSPPAPNNSDDWPMETGGLPLEPGLSRSHWVRHRATNESRRFYWCAEDGSWYANGWAKAAKQLTVRQVHYSYTYVGPATR